MLIPPNYPSATEIDFGVPCVAEYIDSLSSEIKAAMCSTINSAIANIEARKADLDLKVQNLTNLVPAMIAGQESLTSQVEAAEKAIESITSSLEEVECPAIAALLPIITQISVEDIARGAALDVAGTLGILNVMGGFSTELATHEANLRSYLTLLGC